MEEKPTKATRAKKANESERSAASGSRSGGSGKDAARRGGAGGEAAAAARSGGTSGPSGASGATRAGAPTGAAPGARSEESERRDVPRPAGRDGGDDDAPGEEPVLVAESITVIAEVPLGDAAYAAPIDARQRYLMIAERAYYRAEQRGFEAGHEVDDWLAAEREVNELLTAG